MVDYRINLVLTIIKEGTSASSNSIADQLKFTLPGPNVWVISIHRFLIY